MKSNLVKLRTVGDERGLLTFLEEGEEISFPVKRVYYLTKTSEGVSRGFHAHKELDQIAICVAGRCDMLLDDGLRRETFSLSSPDVGLRIGRATWREMHNFSSDCVLLVLASELYDEKDYLRNYDDFLTELKRQKA